MGRSSRRVRVRVVQGGEVRTREDLLAVEEPLEVRVDSPGGDVPLAVTMRTPGHDLELAAGFLFSEGVIAGRDDIVSLRHCGRVPAEARDNTVTASLAHTPTVRAAALARRFTVSSACGVCGLESLAALEQRGVRPVRATGVRAELLVTLPDRLRAAQAVFSATGGLHAAGPVHPGRSPCSARGRTSGGTTPWTSWSAGRCWTAGCRWPAAPWW